MNYLMIQTPIVPVIKYVIEEYKKRKEVFDEIWIVLPCSPMIKSADLLQASFMFKKTDNSKSLMAVAEYAVPIGGHMKLMKMEF